MRALACTVLAVIFFAACSSSPTAKSAPSAATEAPQAVAVAQVESERLDTTLSLPAQITPYEAMDVYPKVTGFLDEIRVDRGSRVHAGELIARISAPELVAQRSQAEAAVQSAEARLVCRAGKTLPPIRPLNLHLQAAAETPGVVAKNDLLLAAQTAAADRAEVEAAEKNVEAARDSLRSPTQLESYLEIRAPFDGFVTARKVHPGALVGPASGQPGAQAMVRIETTNRLRIVVPVPEALSLVSEKPKRSVSPSPPTQGTSARPLSESSTTSTKPRERCKSSSTSIMGSRRSRPDRSPTLNGPSGGLIQRCSFPPRR